MRGHFCRGCGKKLEADWKACPYCKIDIMEECSNCGKGVDINWHSCPFCGSQIHKTTIEEHKTHVHSDEKKSNLPITKWRKVSSETHPIHNIKKKIAAVVFPMTSNADKYYTEGVALSELGKYSEAITCYDKAIAIDPNYVEAWNNKGNALYMLGKYSEAITCFDKVIEIDPNNDVAWTNKGFALALQKKYSEAITCYDKAIAINPKFALAWGNKCDALQKQGRWNEAEECFNKAKKLGYTE